MTLIAESENSLQSRETTRKLMKMEQFKNDCSSILSGALYVSGYSVASDLGLLKTHGITHIGKFFTSYIINKQYLRNKSESFRATHCTPDYTDI